MYKQQFPMFNSIWPKIGLGPFLYSGTQLTDSMNTIVTAQNMIYKLSFSITFVNNNPHIAIWDSLFFVVDDIGVSWAIDVLG